VHTVPPGVGSQTPFAQVKPVAQGAASQLARHCPSAHTFPVSHSLENLHVFVGEVHDPATHVCPGEQSVAAVAVVQAHGPAAPPQASQVPPTHALPSPQSLFVVHSFCGPGSVVGAEQSPALQTSPLAQGTASEHVVVQPPAVQTEPAGQLEAPVHACFAGGATLEQPYASQS
jgi:hypothetical protein